MIQRLAMLTLIAGSFLFVNGCNEASFERLEPKFDISWPADWGYVEEDFNASAFAFGAVPTGTVADVPVQISNPGSANLDICGSYIAVATFDEDGALASELIVENNPEIAWSGPSEPMVLEDKAALTEVLLRFTPLYGDPLPENLYLVVKHELNYNCDEGVGTGLYIPIIGEGDGDPVPDIQAKPDQVEFADLEVGELSAVHDVRLTNVGPGLLEIDGISLSDDSHFQITADSTAGAMLETGDSVLFSVQFAPTSAGNHTADVLVDSNDPDEDPLHVQLIGLADDTKVGKGPVAVCGPDFDSAPFTTENYDGSDSYDTDDLPLTFQWVLTPPAGSASTLNSYTVASPSIYLDIAGDYQGELTVTNTNGQSDSCTQTISAIPNENFRVELFWANPDDLDLHLLEANDGSGNQGQLEGDGDCYYANCQGSFANVDWGVAGNTLDNPSLDLDDIPGTGPENINIQDPAVTPYDGWYQVVVHDYPFTEEYPNANDTTVNIYLNGVLAQTFTFQVPAGEDTYYYVAKIHWPTGNIVACNGLSGCP